MRFSGFHIVVGAIGLCAKLGAAASTPFADFEAKLGNNTLGGYFYMFDDRADSGSSVILSQDSISHYWDSSSFAAGANGTESAARMAFKYGAKLPTCGGTCTYPQTVGMGSGFLSAGNLDLTGATAISFWAKASVAMKVSFSFNLSTVTQGGADYAKLISVGTAWTKYTVKLPPAADLAQPSWATRVSFDPASAKAMGWTISKGDNPSLSGGEFLLDEIVIEGWTPPVEPTRLRAAVPAPGHGARSHREAMPTFRRAGKPALDARGRALLPR